MSEHGSLDQPEHEPEPTWVRRAKRRAWIPVAFGVVVLAALALILLVAIPRIVDEIG
jgi:hypothetical protein